MKGKAEDILATIFFILSIILLIMFAMVGCSCSRGELDPIQEQIKEESIIF